MKYYYLNLAGEGRLWNFLNEEEAFKMLKESKEEAILNDFSPDDYSIIEHDKEELEEQGLIPCDHYYEPGGAFETETDFERYRGNIK